MKKQLLAIALMASGLAANAQVWSENFSSATPPALPNNWLQNNVDGFTVNNALASYSFGTNAWVTRNMTQFFGANYANCAISTSWYSAANTSNDWMISPSFSVPVNAVLNWEALASNGSFPDGYKIWVSTTGTTVANFTASPAIFTIAAEDANNWQARGVSLNTYSNQTIRIAFQNNSNDEELLFIDNIEVKVPAVSDGQMVSVNAGARYRVGAGNQSIQGTLKQLGYSTATTAVVNYKVNNGATTTETVTFNPGITYYNQSAFSFTSPASLALGANRVKVWVSAINGGTQAVVANDTAYATCFVAQNSVTINGFVEEFTSSTCNPCASLNSTFDPALASSSVNIPGSGLVAVKYQVNWPSPGNDPSYNQDVFGRRVYYDISAAPTVLYNGTAGAGNQANINASKTAPGYASISQSVTVNGSAISGTAVINPTVTTAGNWSTVKVYQALLQKAYTYTNGTTSQTSYNHVMRKMFPTAGGVAMQLTSGTTQTVNFTHNATFATLAAGTATGSNNFWTTTGLTYEYVVWLQDTVNNQVLQAQVALGSIGTGVVEFKNNAKIGVYPNPAKDNATVGVKINKSTSVELSIMDITGRVVYSNVAKLEEGDHEMKINTSEFATGTYNIVVKTDDGILKEKLIIVK